MIEAELMADALDDLRDHYDGLDPEIAALADACPLPESPIPWAQLEATTGCSREVYYLRLAEGLLVAGARLLTGYRQSKRRASEVRHRAYAAGVRTPRPRKTLQDKTLDEARKWGWL